MSPRHVPASRPALIVRKARMTTDQEQIAVTTTRLGWPEAAAQAAINTAGHVRDMCGQKGLTRVHVRPWLRPLTRLLTRPRFLRYGLTHVHVTRLLTRRRTCTAALDTQPSQPPSCGFERSPALVYAVNYSIVTSAVTSACDCRLTVLGQLQHRDQCCDQCL
jgi:hypothetical protein